MDLYQGTGEVSNINLDLSSLNEQLAVVGIPLEVLDGFVRHIKVEIPCTLNGSIYQCENNMFSSIVLTKLFHELRTLWKFV